MKCYVRSILAETLPFRLCGVDYSLPQRAGNNNGILQPGTLMYEMSDVDGKVYVAVHWTSAEFEARKQVKAISDYFVK